MENRYDVIVVGGGPAGLSAALYLARARYRVLVLEKEHFGGQIAITEEVVNYPGIEQIGGRELSEAMQRQAKRFGAELLNAQATGFSLEGRLKTIQTDRGVFTCRGVVLAIGAKPRRVGFRGEETHAGRGVAYCATCDGELFTGKEVFVVGGGYAAAEESVFLTKYASHVTILVRRSDFSCAPSVAEKAKRHEKITVLTDTVLEEVSGENGLSYARYKNTATGEVTEYRAKEGESFGVFVLAGYAPDTQALKGIVELQEQGYIVTDANRKTSIDGVYAAGDVCIKPLRQVVTATADGALAATELEKYLAKEKESTGAASEERVESAAPKTQREGLFETKTQQQLQEVFAKMERPLLLKAYTDGKDASRELVELLEQLAASTDKLTVETVEAEAEDTPCVRVCYADGTQTGLAFHGVPGGHEFQSFILGLYNAAGPGQAVDAELQAQIDAIRTPVRMRILVTLSCGMCPELVTAAQLIAAKNPLVEAQVYDIRYFPALREKYRVFSVPCLVIGEDRVSFGKKNLRQLLAMLP